MKELRSVWWDYISILSFQALAVPVSLLFIVLVTRFIGPAEYGHYNVVLSVAQPIVFLSTSWTSNALIRFGKEEFIVSKSFAGTFWARCSILSLFFILAVIGTLFFNKAILDYIGGDKRDYLVILILAVLIIASDFLCSLLQVINKLKFYGLSIFLRQASLLSLSFLFIFGILKPYYKSVLYFDIISYIVMGLVAIPFLKITYFKPVEFDYKKAKKIFFYSWSLIFAFSAGYLFNWVDIYVIKLYRGLEEVGIYQLAYRLIIYLGGFLTAGAMVLFPLFIAVKNKEESHYIERFIERIVPQAGFFWGIALSILILFSEYIFGIVFDKNYFASYKIFNIFLIGVGFQVIIAMYTTLFAVFDIMALRSGIIIVMTLISIIGDFVLVPKIGIQGAAISTTLSMIFGAVGCMFPINNLKGVKNSYIFVFTLLPLASFCAVTYLPKIAGFIVVGFTIIFVFYFAKKKKTFSTKDAEIFNLIDMPQGLRNIIKKAYLFLS